MATYFEQTIGVIMTSLSATVQRLTWQLPQILVGVSIAVLFLVLGWIVGYFAKIVVKNILNALKLDEWAAEHKLKDAVGGVELSSLAGSFAKWYIIIIFLTQATEFVQLNSFKTFMNALVFFLPVLLSALILFSLGMLFAKFVRNKLEATQHKYKRIAGKVLETLVVFVTLLMALRMIGINVSFLENAFLIAVASFFIVLSLIFGISLGLAFKDDAKVMVEEIRKGLKS